jgi:hypothetical protein
MIERESNEKKIEQGVRRILNDERKDELTRRETKTE